MTGRATPRKPVDGMTETEDMLVGMVTALAAQLSATRERVAGSGRNRGVRTR
jgi:hypothetical protein